MSKFKGQVPGSKVKGQVKGQISKVKGQRSKVKGQMQMARRSRVKVNSQGSNADGSIAGILFKTQ